MRGSEGTIRKCLLTDITGKSFSNFINFLSLYRRYSLAKLSSSRERLLLRDLSCPANDFSLSSPKVSATDSRRSAMRAGLSDSFVFSDRFSTIILLVT